MQEHYRLRAHCRPGDRVGKSVQRPRYRVSDDEVGALLGISVSYLILLAGALAYITSVSLLVRLTDLIVSVRLVHGFGRWSPATTNTMLFPAISISCVPSGNA